MVQHFASMPKYAKINGFQACKCLPKGAPNHHPHEGPNVLPRFIHLLTVAGPLLLLPGHFYHVCRCVCTSVNIMNNSKNQQKQRNTKDYLNLNLHLNIQLAEFTNSHDNLRYFGPFPHKSTIIYGSKAFDTPVLLGGLVESAWCICTVNEIIYRHMMTTVYVCEYQYIHILIYIYIHRSTYLSGYLSIYLSISVHRCQWL